MTNPKTPRKSAEKAPGFHKSPFKTLAELPKLKESGGVFVHEKDLRADAIKEVKIFRDNALFPIDPLSKLLDLNCDEVGGVEKYIMWKNNLKEGDIQ